MIKQKEEEETQLYVWGNNSSGQLGINYEQELMNFPNQLVLNMTITQISCGEEHTAFLSNYGCLYTIGSNNYGALGIGSEDYGLIENKPQLILEKRVKEVRCGWGHTGVILDSGSVLMWGRGDSGQLGNGEFRDSLEPIEIKLNRDIWIAAQNISCGARHTIIITKQGYALGFGANEAGQLGLSHRNKVIYPERIQVKENLIKISCGVSHSLFLTQSRKVYSAGSNSLLQLGIGCQYKNSPTPIQIQDMQDIVEIAAGNHSAALNSRGQLYLWGQGSFGSLEKPVNYATGKFFLHITIGSTSGAAVDEEGSVFVWGSNLNGELGTGDENGRVEPSLVTALQGEYIQDISMGQGFTIAIKKYKNLEIEQNEIQLVQSSSNLLTTQLINSEKDYIIKTLKIEQEERQALERINRDLRNKILELTEGQDGLSTLKSKIKEKDEQIFILKQNNDDIFYKNQKSLEELREIKQNFQQSRQITHQQGESLNHYENKLRELEDALQQKQEEFDGAQMEAHRINEEFKTFEKQEQEQLIQIKIQLSDLTSQLQGEQDLREQLQKTLNHERISYASIQAYTEQLTKKTNSQGQQIDLLTKQLHTTLMHYEKLTEALQTANNRVQLLQGQNSKLMQDLAILRTSLYSEIPRESGAQPLEVQEILKLNKQINETNQQLQQKIKDKDQELIKIKYLYNELVEKHMQRGGSTSYHLSRGSQLGASRQQENQSKISERASEKTNKEVFQEKSQNFEGKKSQIEQNFDIAQEGSKTIKDLLESAHKHAKFMKRILKDIDQEEIRQSQLEPVYEINNNSSPNKNFYEQKQSPMKEIISSSKRFDKIIKEVPENVENEYARSLSEVKAKLAKFQNNRFQNKEPIYYRN